MKDLKECGDEALKCWEAVRDFKKAEAEEKAKKSRIRPGQAGPQLRAGATYGQRRPVTSSGSPSDSPPLEAANKPVSSGVTAIGRLSQDSTARSTTPGASSQPRLRTDPTSSAQSTTSSAASPIPISDSEDDSSNAQGTKRKRLQQSPGDASRPNLKQAKGSRSAMTSASEDESISSPTKRQVQSQSKNSKVGELERQQIILEADIKEKDEKLLQLAQDKSAIEELLDEKDRKLSRLNEQVEQNSQEIVKLAGEKSAVEAAYNTKDQELSHLAQQMDARDTSEEELRQTDVAKTERIRVLELTEKQLRQADLAKDERIRSLQVKEKEPQDYLDKQGQESKTQIQRIQSLELTEKDLQQRLIGQGNQVAAKDQSLEDLEGAVKDLKYLVDRKSKQAETKDQYTDELKSKVNDLGQRVFQQGQFLANHLQRIRDLEQEKTDLEQEKRDLKYQVGQQLKEFDIQERQMDLLLKKFRDLKKTSGKTETELTALRAVHYNLLQQGQQGNTVAEAHAQPQTSHNDKAAETRLIESTAALEEQQTTLQATNHHLEAEKVSLEAEVSQLQQWKTALRNIQKQYTDADDNLQVMQVKHRLVEADIGFARVELAQMQTEKNMAVRQLNNLTQINAEASEAIRGALPLPAAEDVQGRLASLEKTMEASQALQKAELQEAQAAAQQNYLARLVSDEASRVSEGKRDVLDAEVRRVVDQLNRYLNRA